MSDDRAPGPVYDNALRDLGHAELLAVLDFLGVGPTPEPFQLDGSLPSTRTLYADLIADLGDGRLVHVEFVRRPEADLPQRMLEYRSRIQHREATTDLTQHVLVLAEGTVTNPFTNASPITQLVLELHVVYLRDQDPEQLLLSPGLAPLAVLGRAEGPGERRHILRRALAVISRIPDPVRRHQLTGIAATLAGIHLDPATIEELTLEVAMPITLDEDTVAGRAIAAAAEARGEARGEALGEARGRTAERTATLAVLLRRTFGDDPRIDAVARRMAELPQEQALDLALRATALDDLAT